MGLVGYLEDILDRLASDLRPSIEQRLRDPIGFDERRQLAVFQRVVAQCEHHTRKLLEIATDPTLQIAEEVARLRGVITHLEQDLVRTDHVTQEVARLRGVIDKRDEDLGRMQAMIARREEGLAGLRAALVSEQQRRAEVERELAAARQELRKPLLDRNLLDMLHTTDMKTTR